MGAKGIINCEDEPYIAVGLGCDCVYVLIFVWRNFAGMDTGFCISTNRA